ncbi:glycosyltransferase family 1 protein [Myriangium duriaei CBS 260.36]|uniref:Glycosyltransferase family 1 protein n=1 Tax=Myriangium duriaei CBS 260.36 TaxID=1168546 RepID=A0A9P4MJI7_9PEZI|nr:glycosyltransferase family 1 protein [Myriangium duriaei CBS 260.36]
MGTDESPPDGGLSGVPPQDASSRMIAQAMAIAQGNAEDQTRVPDNGESHPLSPGFDHADVESLENPPPAYGEHLHRFSDVNSALGVDTNATVADDGRIDINIKQHSRRLSAVFAPVLQKQLQATLQNQPPLPPPYIPPSLGGEPGQLPPPRMQLVIHVVGSRGDVQPFVALGKVLQETYGHRVRLATHPVFKDFVLENGLEFFSIGGDPAELMAFMVKNPGLMPGFDTVRSGDVGKRRKEIATMIKGCWRSCIEAGNGLGVEATDDTVEDWMNYSRIEQAALHPQPWDRHRAPFIADAIIANPPSFAHIHCAEKLGVPLHIMFTMPYSPTQAFPHPLANIQSSNADATVTNFMTYGLVDMMTWQGLGDIINRFRQSTLGLEPISLIWAPNMLSRLRIPHTYCWSPALIPKPRDWGNNISISGFYFLSLASNYTPDADLKAFLDAGPPPVYIGFGSIVVDDPNAMTTMIFDAIRKTGQRALVSKGWGGIGANELGIPEGVMMLGNVPHDWLFQRVSCVVHHGGAGTTAAGIAAGKPTVVVPFFGDQPFWGAMVAKAGAGPVPIPYKKLDADQLAESIKTALQPSTLERAKELAESIANENGCQTGAQSFHQQLHVDDMRCSLAPHKVAVWRLKRTKVRLSALAATVLGNEGYIDFKDLKLFRAREYETDTGPTDPITGVAGSVVGTLSSILMGFADFPVEALKALKVHPDTAKPKKEKKERKPSGVLSPSASRTSLETPRTSAESSSINDGKSTPSNQTGVDPLDSAAASTPQSPISPPIQSPASASRFSLDESLAKIRSSGSADDSQGDDRRGSSMRMALRDQLGSEFISGQESSLNPSTRPRSRSRACSRSSSRSRHRSASPARTQNIGEHIDTAIGTSKGIGRIISASLRSPMEASHALAKGFHNAPKLYGDDTVREAEHITDFRSGLKAASKEFGYGLYDGITGLVTQPIVGAKKEGAAGFIKGIGKGIGGVILKPPGGAIALYGYSMKGVYKELQSHYSNPVQNYMIAARTAHGMWSWHNSTHEERDSIVERWVILQMTLKKKKNPDEILKEWHQKTAEKMEVRRQERHKKIKEFLGKTDFGHLLKRSSSRGKKPGKDDDLKKITSGPAAGSHPAEPATPSDVDMLTPASSFDEPRGQLHHASTFPAPHHSRFAHESSGIPMAGRSSAFKSEDQLTVLEDDADHEHDEELEAAIRASVAEASTGNTQDDRLLERALRASVAEIQLRPVEIEDHHDDDEESRAIEIAMKASLQHAKQMEATPPDSSAHGVAAHANEQEQHLANAIKQSLEDRENRERERKEEEIVMEYIKKQSLLEEQHRKAMAGQEGSAGSAGSAGLEGKSS